SYHAGLPIHAASTADIYTLSLHDALPISERGIFHHDDTSLGLWTEAAGNRNYYLLVAPDVTRFEDLHSARIRVDNLSKRLTVARSEEHTSELQSREKLVCRLLLEKKKNKE